MARAKQTTLKDIAKLTGLSVSTVSRALSHSPAIPEETRNTVLEAARQLHYRPNAHAAALRKQETKIIGVAIPDVENPYFASLAAAIQAQASTAGYSLLLGHTAESAKEFERTVDIFSRHRVDGMILVPHEHSLNTIQEISELHIPLVLVDRTGGTDSIPSVTSDPVPGMSQALKLLNKHADTALGYLAGPQDTSTGRERLSVVETLIRTHDLDVRIAYGGYKQEEGYTKTLELLRNGVRSILAGDSMLTVGALQAIHEQGITLGTDCHLIGFDELPMFHYNYPPLSTIDQGVQEMGKQAAMLLLNIIERYHQPESILLPTTLHLRGELAHPIEKGSQQ